MDAYTYYYLKEQPKLLEFIRYEPIWYRYLSRDGAARLSELEREAKIFYGQTLPQRLKRINQQMQMASMFIHAAELLKD